MHHKKCRIQVQLQGCAALKLKCNVGHSDSQYSQRAQKHCAHLHTLLTAKPLGRPCSCRMFKVLLFLLQFVYFSLCMLLASHSPRPSDPAINGDMILLLMTSSTAAQQCRDNRQHTLEEHVTEGWEVRPHPDMVGLSDQRG